jgi:hypothetical protein
MVPLMLQAPEQFRAKGWVGAPREALTQPVCATFVRTQSSVLSMDACLGTVGDAPGYQTLVRFLRPRARR